MKYQFYAIIYDVAGNTTPVGSSASPAKEFSTNIQKVTGITINPSSAQTKNIGDTFTITPTISPSDANNKNVNWSSSNTAVADFNGSTTTTTTSTGNAVTIKCKAAGTTTITATAADGSGKSASLTLTVKNPLNSLTLDKTQTTILKDGYTSTVTATTDPVSYDANNISWTIADTSIATVSTSGKTATIKSTSKLGTTTLTVKAGDKTKTVTVNVVNFVTTTYSYTGTVQQVDLPAGTYKLEVWGAQGGSRTSTQSVGGKGGYSIGIITLTNNTKAYVYVGGEGGTYWGKGTAKGGFNGGGSSTLTNSSGEFTSGGGGGTDMRIGQDSLYSRVIVAGGGGGGCQDESYNSSGGYGGGNEGCDGEGYGDPNNTSVRRGLKGTQITKGRDGDSSNSTTYVAGGFGIASSCTGQYGGAGGRWWLVSRRHWLC